MIHPTVASGKRGDFRRVESGSEIFCKYEATDSSDRVHEHI